MKKLLSILTIISVLFTTLLIPISVKAEEINTLADFEQEYLAAPAVAGVLLEYAGIDNRYGTGRNGGNYISDVARHMGPETLFDGVEKSDICAYESAIASFLNVELDSTGKSLLVKEGTLDPEASYAEAIDNENGTLTLSIHAVDYCGNGIENLDPLTAFYVNDSVLAGNFYFGTSSIPGSGISEWDKDGGVYTITLSRNYFNARPAGYNDGWYRIWDIFINGHLVQDDLILHTTYYMVGDWKMDLYVGTTLYARFIVIEEETEGAISGFFGVGYDTSGSPTGTITGTIDGKSIHMYYERPPEYHYSANFYGTIAADGNSMSGTWTDSGSIVNQPWNMVRQ
jgi:hypothetical protein